MSKVHKLVNSCGECPSKAYYSGGKDECTRVSGRGGPMIVPGDGSIPEWCPLPDWPTAAAEGEAALARGDRHRVVGLFSQGADGELCFHEGRDDPANVAALLDENVTGGPHTMLLAIAAPVQECERGRGSPAECGASPACGCPAALAELGVPEVGVARAQAREVVEIFRNFTKSSHRFHDGRPLHLVAADLLEAFARGGRKNG